MTLSQFEAKNIYQMQSDFFYFPLISVFSSVYFLQAVMFLKKIKVQTFYLNPSPVILSRSASFSFGTDH